MLCSIYISILLASYCAVCLEIFCCEIESVYAFFVSEGVGGVVGWGVGSEGSEIFIDSSKRLFFVAYFSNFFTSLGFGFS